mmetsp:Transcript_88410/g.245444  ORF Transcript_88410/g.245444 Transcript_88410/m.245444 type:complete len:209 (+) Transcript_88410:533-1159(+)
MALLPGAACGRDEAVRFREQGNGLAVGSCHILDFQEARPQLRKALQVSLRLAGLAPGGLPLPLAALAPLLKLSVELTVRARALLEQRFGLADLLGAAACLLVELQALPRQPEVLHPLGVQRSPLVSKLCFQRYALLVFNCVLREHGCGARGELLLRLLRLGFGLLGRSLCRLLLFIKRSVLSLLGVGLGNGGPHFNPRVRASPHGTGP